MDAALHTTQWGGSGPLVVMVHGSAQGSEVGGDRHFSRQAALAGMGWRVVVPDRPGHGRRPSPGRPAAVAADGKLVAELLAGGAHLVGPAFGGCVALAAAAMRPSAVRSLTLIEPAMMPLAADLPAVQGFLKQMMEGAAAASTPAERVVGFARLIRIPDEIRGGSGTAELERMGKALEQLRLPPPPVLREQLGVVKASGIPLLIVEGGWSPAFAAVADRVAEVGGGQHVVVASSHHFPQLVSDEFNQLLVRFMVNAEKNKER